MNLRERRRARVTFEPRPTLVSRPGASGLSVSGELREAEELSAHVRAMAVEPVRLDALRPHHGSLVAFDDVISGTTAVPTDPSFDEALGGWDALALEAVVSQLTAAGTTLAVTLEHSADRRHWLTRSTPISAAALSTTATTAVAGSDAGATPSLGFVRVSIRLNPFAGTPSARVRVVVTGRGR